MALRPHVALRGAAEYSDTMRGTLVIGSLINVDSALTKLVHRLVCMVGGPDSGQGGREPGTAVSDITDMRWCHHGARHTPQTAVDAGIMRTSKSISP